MLISFLSTLCVPQGQDLCPRLCAADTLTGTERALTGTGSMSEGWRTSTYSGLCDTFPRVIHDRLCHILRQC